MEVVRHVFVIMAFDLLTLPASHPGYIPVECRSAFHIHILDAATRIITASSGNQTPVIHAVVIDFNNFA
jgi:hypothetical protein